ncbi:MAG: hypothetical protein JWM33_2024 [Caulobacteraceae bacterium]|nr:hypothetical protein [Caulobacteraceae bacterium]
MKLRVLATLAVLWTAATLSPAVAQTSALSLSQVAAAAQSQNLPVLRQALADPQLLSSLAAIDPDAAAQLQLSIGAAFEAAGDRASAILAYDQAVASIAKLHDGHDDLAQVDPLRKTAALRRASGDLNGAVADIDKAFAIATAAKHPALREIQVDYAAIRAAFTAANPAIPLPPPYVPRGGASSGYDIVEVYYATHRLPTGATDPGRFYGGDRGPMTYGKAYVSVPRDRPAGSLPKPSFWKAEFRPDPDKHVILTDVKPSASREVFFSDLQTRIGASKEKEAFIFIHGFNNSFEDGAERTAQLAADLAIDGAPILYSWPSKASVLAYATDEQEALVDSQIADLAAFMNSVAKSSGATQVHLVAHSMGNRFLLKALTKLAALPASERPKFDEIVLAAPDVGVDDFTAMWPQIRNMGQRYTLYASSRDKALMISSELHDMQRIGDAHKIVVTDGLQTVETTAASGGLLGHTDFAGNALDDFRALMWYSLAPASRCVLQTAQANGQPYWVFAGAGVCPEGEFREAVTLARTEGSPAAAMTKVQAMISQLGPTAATPDVTLLQEVQKLLAAFQAALQTRAPG